MNLKDLKIISYDHSKTTNKYTIFNLKYKKLTSDCREIEIIKLDLEESVQYLCKI